MLACLIEGKVKLWISWDDARNEVEAAAVTEIVDHPRVRELKIWLVGGRNMKSWVRPMARMIEEFARAYGCTLMSGAMRRGWIRVGGPEWHETGAMFERQL